MKNILQHYDQSEQEFVLKVTDWCETVETRKEIKSLGFFDPRQCAIIKQIVGRYDQLNVLFDGGYEAAERKYAIISHVMRSVDEVPISFIHVKYNQKFHTLEHRDILGALMNQGLKREVFGDIIVGESAYFVLDKAYYDYLSINMKKIGRVSIDLEEQNIYDISSIESKTEKSISVSSMRLDNVVAKAYNLSRNSVKEFILSGFVKVNHQVMKNHSHTLSDKDLISLRKHGRVQLDGTLGSSKRGKIILKILK